MVFAVRFYPSLFGQPLMRYPRDTCVGAVPVPDATLVQGKVSLPTVESI